MDPSGLLLSLVTGERVTIPTRGGKIAVAAVGLVILAAILWSFVGSIPMTVEGSGIIIRKDRQIITLQSTSNGTVAKMNIL